MKQTHLRIQKQIQALLPPNEAFLERRFPQIGRIADLVWEPRKLIFEVQCSPITLKEVKQRKKDYESCGYRLIWILHDKRFNRRWPTPAEIFLREGACYFTNGTHFYDQEEIIKGRQRTMRGTPLPISLVSDRFDRRPKPPTLPPKKNLYLRLLDALVSRYSAGNL